MNRPQLGAAQRVARTRASIDFFEVIPEFIVLGPVLFLTSQRHRPI